MTTERVRLNEAKLTEIIEIILKSKEKNEFVFSESYLPPEKPYIDLLKQYGENTGSDCFAVNAIFLTTSLIRGQKARPFMEKITDWERLQKFAWIFNPEKALLDKTATEKACLEFFKPPGYCKDAVYKWCHNMEILLKYGGDIKNFFHAYNDKPDDVAKAIYVRNRAKTAEKLHTFWGYGQKLTYLALQWISLYGLYNFEDNKNLPVDFQLSRIAIQTDSLILDGEANADEVIARNLMPAIRKICLDRGIDPREVSQAMWTFGSEGCNNRLHDSCPLEKLCTKFITSKLYQRSGRFSPEDEGRYKQQN